jgi:predicted RNA-binding protein with TRAM domain
VGITIADTGGGGAVASEFSIVVVLEVQVDESVQVDISALVLLRGCAIESHLESKGLSSRDDGGRGSASGS